MFYLCLQYTIEVCYMWLAALSSATEAELKLSFHIVVCRAELCYVLCSIELRCLCNAARGCICIVISYKKVFDFN